MNGETGLKAGLSVSAWMLVGLFFLPLGYAADPSLPGVAATSEATTDAAGSNPIPDSLRSPRATMRTFLEAMDGVRKGHPTRMDDAVSTLDLSGINPLVRTEKGEELAWTLMEVLNRTRLPRVEQFSDRTRGRPFVFQTYPQGRVEISLTEGEGWRFSTSTVQALPAILEGLADQERVAGAGAEEYLPIHLRIRSHLSPAWKRPLFILEQWQWLGILLIITVGIVLDKLLSVILRAGVRHWRERYARGSYRQVSNNILRPLGLMLMAAVWWAGLNVLGLPDDVLAVLLVSAKFLAGVSGVWGAYRLVDLLGAFLMDRAAATESKLDDALVPMVTKVLKVFVTVIGIVFVADNLNIDVTSLLAGLGLGGLAFALAAKDVVGNLFGSVTVLLDQTFHVGDWVVVGDVEGTVENIGFRSTRVRTFYNSLVTVPNSTLITANVDNMGRRRYRRLKCNLSVAYDTPPERVEAFCEGVRELVRLHPYMRKDYYHVYFNGFGASSLEILVYVFWSTPDWGTELRERHRFLLDCLRLAKRLGVEFAYPTRTLYLRRDVTGPPSLEEVDFHPDMAQDQAFDLGRREAEAIVKATTGLDAVPPPVSFSAVVDSNGAREGS